MPDHGVITRSPVAWTIDSKPIFDVGAESEDTLDTFGEVAGVARLPGGDVVVADRKSYSLRYFTPAGTLRRAVGRRGDGPGEIPAAGILRILHCGDSLYVMDWNHRMLVFSESGVFSHFLTLAAPRPGDSPYQIACNPAGLFFSYGWEARGESKPGTFRPLVPFWIANRDGTIRANAGMHPGSERFGTMFNGRLGGSGPLPIGKEAVLAIGRSRAYIGTADSFAIEVYSLDGKRTGSIVKPRVDLRTTPADIQRFLMLDTAGKSEARKAMSIKLYAESVTYPKTIPAYSALLVDSDDDLWVQRYPRAAEMASHWVVFSPSGVETAHIDLPATVVASEIGRDYIVGVSIEPPDGVHHVKEFRLHRGAIH
jgi:hypothetical protein